MKFYLKINIQPKAERRLIGTFYWMDLIIPVKRQNYLQTMRGQNLVKLEKILECNCRGRDNESGICKLVFLL